jgi:hypothetical protein
VSADDQREVLIVAMQSTVDSTGPDLYDTEWARIADAVLPLLAQARTEGAAEVVARVEAVADWCADRERETHDGLSEYDDGARDVYDIAEQRIRAAMRGDS